MKKETCRIQKTEIFYNVINSALAGGLVLLGSLSSGELTAQGVGAAFLAGAIVMITKFKEYWDGEKKEYSTTKLFNFLP